MWALQAETQLFLAQLRQDREQTLERVLMVCTPGGGLVDINERRVAYRAELGIYDMILEAIGAAIGEVAHA